MQEILSKIYNNFLDYYSLVNWQEITLPLRVISIFVSLFLIVFILIIFFKIKDNIRKDLIAVTESIAAPDFPKKDFDKKWQAIMDRLEKENESDDKLALIEADNIFDDLLKKIGYEGNDMGERLKQITKAQLANIDELWQAHKVRNRIAHEQDFKLTHAQAKRAVEIYQRAMEDLEAL